MGISIHALREEGDGRLRYFGHQAEIISIHALREEGDDKHALVVKLLKIFLSTPSARRATGLVADIGDVLGHFYPRPPRGGRPLQPVGLRTPDVISIHALREEGDVARCGDSVGNRRFLSTPSARRATVQSALVI